MRRSSFGTALLCGAICAMACGGSVSSPDNGGGNDSGNVIEAGGDDTGALDDTTPTDDTAPVDDTDVPPVDAPPPVDSGLDHGAPSDVYPAFKPDLPQLADNGGTTLTSPVIVTVTFAGDPNADLYEKFGDSIGASAYWKAVTGEYGIGPAVSGASNHVRVSGTPPATMSARDISTFVATNAGTGGWPAPTANTIYVLYMSSATKVLSFGGADICSTPVGGYHSATRGSGRSVAYAVLPQCKGASGATTTTVAASHELGEAAVDPFQNNPGWVHFDAPHLSWELFQQFNDENGDACEFYLDSAYLEGAADFPFNVQRQWSNVSAKAGKNPCVPTPSDVYFNTAPLALEDVTADLSSVGLPSSVKSKGYHVAVGETKTFAVGLWSEAKRTPWNLKVFEGNPAFGAVPSTMTLSIDTVKGQNGQKALVTVKVNSATKYRAGIVTVESYVFGQNHYMPILIGN